MNEKDHNVEEGFKVTQEQWNAMSDREKAEHYQAYFNKLEAEGKMKLGEKFKELSEKYVNVLLDDEYFDLLNEFNTENENIKEGFPIILLTPTPGMKIHKDNLTNRRINELTTLLLRKYGEIEEKEAQMMLDDLGEDKIMDLYDDFSYYRVDEYSDLTDRLRTAIEMVEKQKTR